jgi:hypothetical protein
MSPFLAAGAGVTRRGEGKIMDGRMIRILLFYHSALSSLCAFVPLCEISSSYALPPMLIGFNLSRRAPLIT